MKVYELAVTDGNQVVAPAPLTGTALAAVAGVRQGAGWEPSPVTLVTEDDGRVRARVDCPFLSSALLVVKDAALDRVAGLLSPYAELLALDCPQEALTAVNVLAVHDALDEDASALTRFSSGRIMSVDRWAFHPDRVPADGLFKVPQYLRGATLCTGPTVDRLQEQLTGLTWQEVWSGD